MSDSHKRSAEDAGLEDMATSPKHAAADEKKYALDSVVRDRLNDIVARGLVSCLGICSSLFRSLPPMRMWIG